MKPRSYYSFRYWMCIAAMLIGIVAIYITAIDGILLLVAAQFFLSIQFAKLALRYNRGIVSHE